MDTQLQELIDAIKAEGVQTAEKQAEQILAAAEAKASEITADAESRARQMIEDARKEQAGLDMAGREALKQAARDLILGVQARLTEMFKAVTVTAAGEAISADILENTIVSVVSAWSQGRDEPVDILLNEADLNRLEQRLRSRFADEIASGTEVRANDAVRSGFRVSTRDGSMYYDFTVETIADSLSTYVGPRLAKVLKEASDAGKASGGTEA